MANNKIIFLVDEYMDTRDHPGIPTFYQACIQNGYSAIKLNLDTVKAFNPLANIAHSQLNNLIDLAALDTLNEMIALANQNGQLPILFPYGSTKFVNALRNRAVFFDGYSSLVDFGPDESLSMLSYMSQLCRFTNFRPSFFWNNSPIWTSWELLEKHNAGENSILYRINTPNIFIRPNVVTKTFPGQIFQRTEAEDFFNTINQIYRPFAEELVLLHESRIPAVEYRFFILNNEVLSGSQYLRNGELDIRTDVDPKAQKLAEDVAQSNYQPQDGYVLDIAIPDINQFAYILEVNAFSCSGTYACDTVKLTRSIHDYLMGV